jgi:hypothetical protein
MSSFPSIDMFIGTVGSIGARTMASVKARAAGWAWLPTRLQIHTPMS